MRKIRPILSWILVMAMLVTNVDYVRATSTPSAGETKETLAEDISAGDVVTEDISANDVSNGNVNNENEQEEDVSTGGVSESDISEGDTSFIDVSENIVVDVSVNEADSVVVADSTMSYSGEISGLTWQITSDGVLTISGEQTTGSNPIEPSWPNLHWLEYKQYITSAIITAKKVTSTSCWFYECENMTEIDISGLDSSLTTDMSYMFAECGQLSTIDISNLNTSNVKNMEGMFYGCVNLSSLDCSNFNTANVTNMCGMFSSCPGLTSLNLSGFNTVNVTNMFAMFEECKNLTSLDLSSFDTSNVTNMSGMFYDCRGLTSLDLSNFNTTKVTDMSSMFLTSYVEYDSHSSNLTTLNISSFNTSNVTNMSGMFAGCNSLTSLDLSHFDTSKVTSMSGMFWYCEDLTSLNISNFDTSNVTYMNHMFSSCNNLTLINVSNFNTSNVVDMENMFYDCKNITALDLSNFDTSKVTNMSWMFACVDDHNDANGNYNHKLTTLNLSSFNTSNVTNMEGMFADCDAFTSLDLSNFNTAKVTNMKDMFLGCNRLISLNLSNFDTSNVTNMRSMFFCYNLSSLDISNFNTAKVTDMGYMFCSTNLTSLDLSHFDTSNVTNMCDMFGLCRDLTSLDISNFDTSNVTDMYSMFHGCSNLTYLDLSSFNTTNVPEIYMGSFLYDCPSLSLIKTIPNLQIDVELPVSPMYDQQENEYTSLPLGSSESIYLYSSKDIIPEFVPTIETSGSYYITVYDEKMKTPLSGVSVAFDNQCFTTDKNGSIKLSGNKTSYPSVTFTKDNYTTKTIALNLSNKVNKVYLTPNFKFDIKAPKVSSSVDVEHSVNIAGYKLKWLDLKLNLSMGIPNGNKNGVSQSLPFGFELDEEKNTLKVTFGIKQVDDDGDVNTSSYNKMKSICNLVGKPGASKKIQNFMKKYGHIHEDECGVEISSSVMGYFEYDLYTGKIIESGAIVAMEGEGTLTWRPSIGLGVVYIKATLTISAEGKLIITCTNDNVNFRAELEFKEALKLAGGVGNSKVHLEAGAEGFFAQKIQIPFKNKYESFEMRLGAKLYVEAKFFIFKSEPLEKEFDDFYLWPKEKNSKSKSLVQTKMIPDINQMSLLSRDYNILTTTPLKDTYILENVYPDGEAQICELEDGTLLAVWIADLGTKSDANRTTLVYSINQGDGWSEAKAVYETGRGDFYPSLAVSGNKAVLSYTNLDTIMSENANVTEYLDNIDIYTAVYENGAFSVPTLLSDANNGIMEFDVQIAANNDKMAVIWVENSNNDPFLTEGTNKIYISTFENNIWTKKLIAENLPMVPSMNLSYVSDKATIAYTLDTDNSMDTTEDIELYLWSDGETTRLTSDSKADSNVQFLGDKLYWTSDSEIMQMTISDITSTTSTGISGINDYQILQNATNRAILFIGADGFRNELYLSEEENGTFATPVPVTDYGNHISDYAAVYRDNGEVTTLLFEREVLNNDDTIYGQTNLHMSETLAAHNLVLNEAWYSMADITEDNKLPVNISLYNASSEAVKSVTVTLTAGNETLHTETVTCDLAANGVADIVVNYPITPAQMGQNITVKAVPVDFTDNNLTDNTYEITLGLADVVLKDFVIDYQNGSSVMTGKLTNKGYQTAANVNFTVLEGGADGTAIHTVSCGDLAAGAEYDITYTIPTDKLNFADAFDVKYFHVLCNTDTNEDAYGNNSENIAAFPVKVTGLTLDASELTMTANSTHKLNAIVAPENALDKSVYYLSDKHEVAVVLEDGTIIACKEGTATISAITSDGAFVQSCVVTVTAPAEGTTDGEDGTSDGEDLSTYEMNTRWASLEVGNTQQLSLTDSEGTNVSGITWSSSNADVATVNENGLVTAVSVGTTYIICTNTDNSYYNACVIHVTSKELQALVFEASSKELTEGDTLQMLPTYYPTDTTTNKTLKWSSSDETVATVSTSGVVTAVAGGTATITATSVNSITAQFKVTVNALPRYTVTFDTGLGDEPVEITDILGGNTVTLPTQPTRESYKFKGWFTEKDGKGSEFTAQSIVNDDTYLYAFWEYIPTESEGEKPEDDKPEENVPDGLWVTEIAPQTYTGKAIKPAVKVYDGHTLLKEKTDYTISYKNNTKANDASVAKTTPTITVTGKGNYTGKETVTFKILPRELTDEDIDFSDLVNPASNKVQNPVPVITYKGKKLSNKKDFTVTYPSTGTDAYKAIGNYVVKVTGTGNFAGELEIPFEITNDVLMSKTKITSIGKQTYSGKPIEPEVTVTYKKTTLVKDKDYTVTYKNNVEVGKATVIVTGKGDYAGSKRITFQIVGEPITKATVEGITDKTYNGQEQTQSLTVTLNGTKLTADKDYKVTYENNTNAGKAKLTITGKGRYSGTIKKTFKINAYDLKSDSSKLLAGVPKNLSVTYAKGGSTPAVVLTFDGTELVAKKDYTLSYKNNKKPATGKDAKAPMLMIKGKGNFTGFIEVPFTITTKSLTDAENPVRISVPDIAYNAKAGKFMSKPVLIDSNGKKLAAGTDYEKDIVYKKADGTELTKADTPQVGDVIHVTITGKGYYTGTAKTEYKITQASFAKAKITVKTQSYSGSTVTLDADDITINLNGTELKYGEDYEIVEDSYQNNVKKGTASVTIKGKGNYGGEKTVKFKITSKKFVWFWNLFK